MRLTRLLAMAAVICASSYAFSTPSALAQTFNLIDFFPLQVGDEKRFITFEASANFTSSSIDRWSANGTTTTASGLNAFIVDTVESSGFIERQILAINAEGLRIFASHEFEGGILSESIDFGPGLLLVPASLTLGVPAVTSGSFRFAVEEGEMAATATITTTAIRQERAEVPAGVFDDVIVLEQRREMRVEGEVEPVEIDNVLIWLARGVGAIRQVEVTVDFESGVATELELMGQELLDATIGGREIRPLELSVSANSDRFAPGQSMSLAINLSNQGGNIDVVQYLVMVLPDGSFFSIDGDGFFSALRQAIVRHRLTLTRAGFSDSISIPITASFPLGNYSIFTIFTPANADVFDFDNWLIYEITPFAVSPS